MPSTSPLPPPPENRSGWPYDPPEPAEPLAEYPRISIVTPSYNQGRFIERTIRSVLQQGYPNLEYFVMDGGSNDETVSILKKYDTCLTGWTSERDAGQADAINKGWARATGDILAWINSDDWYCPGAFHAVARLFVANSACQWVHGEVLNIRSGEVAKHYRPRPMTAASCLGRRDYSFHQPGMFWSAALVRKVGPLDPAMHCSFDHDLWSRMLLAGEQPTLLPQPVAFFQLHGESKSYGSRARFTQEDRDVLARHIGALPLEERMLVRRWLRENEADVLLDTVYAQLVRRRRMDAASTLLGNLSLLPMVTPRKAVMGLAWRALVTGRPPSWFRTHQE